MSDARTHPAAVDAVEPVHQLADPVDVSVLREEEVHRRASRHAFRSESRDLCPVDRGDFGVVPRIIGERHRRHRVRDLRDLSVCVTVAVRAVPRCQRRKRVRVRERDGLLELGQGAVAHLLTVGVLQSQQVGILIHDVCLVVLQSIHHE